MGSFAGFTGSQPGVIEKMLISLKHWSPDNTGIHTEPQSSLASLELFNTPESGIDSQPLLHKDIILVANCRIDNRQELAHLFDLDDINSISDISYIAHAYTKWGTACVNYLYGDFAFVLWDKKKQKLFGARDHIGIKTLYYAIANNELIFSSEIKGILGNKLVKPELNEKYFVHAFSGVTLPVTETPYSNIHQFPSASYFEWQNHELSITKYWELGKKELDIPQSEKQQFAIFTELLFEAVRCRLRTPTKIGAEVSGGLDSTGIAAIAMKIMGSGTEFHSYCFGKSTVETIAKDDSGLVTKFCEQYGIGAYLNILNEKHLCIDDILDLKSQAYDDHENNGVPQCGSAFLPIARENKVRIILSGHGGDQLVTSRSTAFFLGASCRREYLNLWQALTKRFNFLNAGFRFVYYVMKGLDGKHFLKENVKNNRNYIKKHGLKPFYVQKYKLWDLPSDRYALHSQSNRKDRYIQCINYPNLQRRAAHHDLTALHYNLEYRFPLLDVRLLDYIFNLPEQTIAPNGEERHLFTKAIYRSIPTQITTIKKSVTGSVPFIKTFIGNNNKMIHQQILATLQNSDFLKYFTQQRLQELKTEGDIHFLSLALLYQKVQKLQHKNED